MLNVEKSWNSKSKFWSLIALASLIVIGGGYVLTQFWEGRGFEETKLTESALADITSVDLLKLVKSSGGKTTVVNIWATWCQPCVEEFPHLIELYKKYSDKGLQLVLVSADAEEDRGRVMDFLSEQGVDFATYIKSEPDNEFVMALGQEWTGALPATFIYDAKGDLKKFWMGDASFEEFENAFNIVNENRETK